jgi:AbiV family abortive infection protein
MNPVDLEAVQRLFQKCLDSSEELLDSAKDAQAKKRNRIAFHLAVLALEEIGKAAMLLAHRVYPHVAEDEDLEESSDGSKLSVDAEDHRKKLFWAMLTPNFDGGVFSSQEFIQLKEIANSIHIRRVTSLYANVDENLPETEISDDDVTRVIGLAESCLNLERLKEIRELDSDAQQLLDWLMKALADPLLQAFVLSEQSKHKLSELGGHSRKWVNWLRDEVVLGETSAKQMMEKEINRTAPTGVLANKPKWRLKIRLHTLSHSIRHKELQEWNNKVIWVKLYPTSKKTELLVEFLLPAKIPVEQVWPTGIQMCSIFVVALNIATVGYFWWYLPEFVSTFYEELVDLDTKAKLGVDYKSPVMGGWKRSALKAQQLQTAGMILVYLMSGAAKEQSLAYSRYMQGIALLSKNDVFGDFSGQALVHFAHAFRMGLASFGEWDGVSANFEQAAVGAMGSLSDNAPMATEFKSLIEAADALEKNQQPSRPITLDDTLKLKMFCDAYLGSRARREMQRANQSDRQRRSQ